MKNETIIVINGIELILTKSEAISIMLSLDLATSKGFLGDDLRDEINDALRSENLSFKTFQEKRIVLATDLKKWSTFEMILFDGGKCPFSQEEIFQKLKTLNLELVEFCEKSNITENTFYLFDCLPEEKIETFFNKAMNSKDNGKLSVNEI